MDSPDTMMCAKFQVCYEGSKSRIIKALFVDLADMDITIQKFSKLPGVDKVILQDYQSVIVKPGVENVRRD